MMTLCERRLLTVEPGKPTNTTFDRKTGRRVEGRVRGLEDVKLRYAFVTIDYWGPEELFKRGSKKQRMLTHFDMIPIGPDGRFSTPPLPANRYDLRLSAMLAATPGQDNQRDDFSGSATVVVPETGAVPPVEIVAKGSVPTTADRVKVQDPKEPRLEVRARDEAGAAGQGLRDPAPWSARPLSDGDRSRRPRGAERLRSERPRNSGKLAPRRPDRLRPGFASTIREFGSVEGLRKVEVILERGTKVRLRVRDSAGKPVPPALMLLPQVYLARHRRDAWFSLSYKDTETRAQAVARTNFLNVRREPGGDFEFHIRPDLDEPLYFGFSHPDVLRYYEKGPVPTSDLVGGVWDIILPSARDRGRHIEVACWRGWETPLREWFL